LGQRFKIGEEQRIGSLGVIPIQLLDDHVKKFQLPPFDRSVTFDELSPTRVDRIALMNSSDSDVFVPSGWIIEGLNQTRMVRSGGMVPAGERVSIDVLCVEMGRWGDFKQGSESGRAPLSVMLAAGAFGVAKGDTQGQEAQTNVWSQVRALEEVHGSNNTSSLAEVMRETMASSHNLTDVAKTLDVLLLPPLTQGFAVTLGGELLLLELFSTRSSVQEVLKGTILGLSMECKGSDFVASNPESIEIALGNLSEIRLPAGIANSGNGTITQPRSNLTSIFQTSKSGWLSSLTLNLDHDLLKESIYV
jgi:hypothetical protein